MNSSKKRTVRAVPSKSQTFSRTIAGRGSRTATIVSTGDAMPNIQRLLPIPPTKDLDCVYALHKFDRLANRGDLADSPPKVRKRSCSNDRASDGKRCCFAEEERSEADGIGAFNAAGPPRQSLELQQVVSEIGKLSGCGVSSGIAVTRAAASQSVGMVGACGAEQRSANLPCGESSTTSSSRARRSAMPRASLPTAQPLFDGDWQSNADAGGCGNDGVSSCGLSRCGSVGCCPGRHTRMAQDEECGILANFERAADASSSSASSAPSPAASSLAPSPAVCGQQQSACRWQGCAEVVGASTLLRHVEEAHLRQRRSSSSLMPSSSTSRRAGRSSEAAVDACQWLGCKVFGQAGRNGTWLDAHVLRKHVPGVKPFECVFLCGQRFSSQTQMNTHVMRKHGDDRSSGVATPATAPAAAGKRGSIIGGSDGGFFGSGASAPKPRKQKKLPKGLQPCVRKTEDFFDTPTYELLQERLQDSMKFWNGLTLDGAPLDLRRGVTFRSQILARRTDDANRRHLLLRWQPTGFLDDNWIPEEELDRHRERQLSIGQVQRIRPDLPSRSTSSLVGSRKRKAYGGLSST